MIHKGSESEAGKWLGTDQRVVALGVARMADAIGNSFLIVVMPLYIASESVTGNFLGFSESLITGLVLGLFGLVTSAFQPLAGRLSDRLGKRQLLVTVGLALFTIVNLCYIMADTYLGLVIIRAFQGMAAALTITASLALVSELSQPADRGHNMGVYNFFRLVGFGIGPLGSGILIDSGPYMLPVVGQIDGFVAAFLLAAAGAFVSTILVALLVRDPEETKPSRESMSIRLWARAPDRWLDPIFTLGIATFVMSMGFALLTSIEPEINRRLSQGAFLFSVEFSILIGALAIVQPLAGNMSDRYGRKRFIVIGLLGLAPVTLMQGLVTAPWQMILARGLQGISAAMVFAPALALAGDLSDKKQVGAQLSVLSVSFALGISFGTILSGYAIRFGFLAPFAAGAVFALLGSFLVQTQVPGVRQRKKADRELAPDRP